MEEFAFFGKDFPAIDWFAVVTSDADNFSQIPRSIYVGGAGDISAVSKDGTEVTFSSVPAGTVLPIQPVRINSTGTTATDLVGLI